MSCRRCARNNCQCAAFGDLPIVRWHPPAESIAVGPGSVIKTTPMEIAGYRFQLAWYRQENILFACSPDSSFVASAFADLMLVAIENKAGLRLPLPIGVQAPPAPVPKGVIEKLAQPAEPKEVTPLSLVGLCVIAAQRAGLTDEEIKNIAFEALEEGAPDAPKGGMVARFG